MRAGAPGDGEEEEEGSEEWETDSEETEEGDVEEVPY